MTTYILRTGSEVSLPAAPLVVQVRSSGHPVPHRWAPRGATAEPPSIIRPDRIVLPSITEPVTLRILPEPGRPRFGSQSVITVVVGPDRPGPDADQIVLDDVDLSGLTQRDLVRFVPDRGQLRVIGLRSAADTPLPPIAEIARDAAREILGHAQLADDQAVELSVLIDTSASMRAALSQGAVSGACDVVAGLATVISPGRMIAGVAAGMSARELGSAAPEEFAAAMSTALAGGDRTPSARDADGAGADDGAGIGDGVAAGTGFRSAVVAGAADRSRTVVVTSGVPADWAGDEDRQLLILGAPGRSTDWPGAGTATVLDRGSLSPERPGHRQIADAVNSLLAQLLRARDDETRGEGQR